MHKFTDTHIEHHDDGSHTIEHLHEDGKSHKKHAGMHLDHVHDSLEKHLRSEEKNEDEKPESKEEEKKEHELGEKEE